uniref:Amino acid transporter transmembrane domain-containing protein n=1 Tax=Octactis speculum TaxID=3111310 RepID=A0A7S2FDR3_9STRA|mmetsp:Transcript_20270/g.27541  ORF Transcript_20270/g.27541 Transcript_20270/m.27541 type:complete len:185 (+) Transcript_20270:3-557(+)|eukprot:CAMPEP_0185744392 /NCGR_PEP_ID=MMETSP1174-20130828/2474_1 /TAXON_ID=35687 /ORGANISM="Dictyocha speculum, Strain CCMP1381" /LENGTH=184 /DNA_ID=CAMNT_0028417743 /DNA_START=1 /DNA_END=555 /DNA_ORIENTATION=-
MIYAIAAVAGYATFGSASTAPVLNNYAASDVLATLTRAATGVSLFGGYALMFVAMRDAFLSSIVPSADDTDTKRGPFSSVQVVSSTAWRIASLALLSFTTLLGVVTTDAGFAASLSGSSLGAALIFCVPSRIFLSCVAKAKASGDSLASNLEVSLVRAFFRFGLVAITLGTTITVLETFTSILA